MVLKLLSKWRFKNIKKAENINKKDKIFNLFDVKRWVYTDDANRINTKITQSILFAFVLSMSFNFFLVCLIIVMLPLKEKVPYFVHFLPKEEQIVYVDEFKTNKKSLKIILEFLARDYIKKRETIDLATEEERYQFVIYLSSREQQTIFQNEYAPKINPKSPFKLYVDKSWIKTVRIISSAILNENQVQVEFEAITSLKATKEILISEVDVAIITFIKNKNEYKGEDYLKNPFGYLVNDYSISVKEKTDKVNYQKNILITTDKEQNNGKKNILNNSDAIN